MEQQSESTDGPLVVAVLLHTVFKKTDRYSSSNLMQSVAPMRLGLVTLLDLYILQLLLLRHATNLLILLAVNRPIILVAPHVKRVGSVVRGI